MLVAQSVEQRTFNPWVGGSNPFGHTTQSAAFGQQPLALELLGGAEYFSGQITELYYMVPYPSGEGSSLLNCQAGESRRMRSNRIGTANMFLW